MSTPAGLVVAHHRDYTGSKMGMWLFLFTELLLFGGMFLLYSVYRAKHPQAFHTAAGDLDAFIGALNTMILLTSSLTMAVSIAAIHGGQKKLSLFCLWMTIGFGVWFLVNKYFEWGVKVHHGIYPNSPTLLQFDHGEILFFGLYFTMTGFHGLHVLVGVVVLFVDSIKLAKKPYQDVHIESGDVSHLTGARLAVVGDAGKPLWTGEEIDESVEEVAVHIKYHSAKKRFRKEDFAFLENSGLYWHLVDVIWIFLFPLFYLIT